MAAKVDPMLVEILNRYDVNPKEALWDCHGTLVIYHKHLERIQGMVAAANPYWHGARLSAHDAYAFTLLRWGGYAGVDPASLPAYKAYIERVMAAPPVAAALERERIKLDTFKAA